MKFPMRVALAVTLALSTGQARAQCRGGASMNAFGGSMLQTPFMGAQMNAFGSPLAAAQLAALQQQALAVAQLQALQQQYVLQAQLLALQNPALQSQLGLPVNPVLGQNQVNNAPQAGRARAQGTRTASNTRPPRSRQNPNGGDN